MNYQYYFAVMWKYREMNDFDKQINYLTEVIEKESLPVSFEIFENTSEYSEAFKTYENYLKIWNQDSKRLFYLNKLLEERQKKLEQKYGERNIKHSIQWKAGSVKLVDFIIALEEQNLIQIVDRVDFMNSLLYGIHPEHKAVWLIAINALDDLIYRLNVSETIFIKDGKPDTIKNYFLKSDKNEMSIKSYKNQMDRDVLPEHLEKLDTALSVL